MGVWNLGTIINAPLQKHKFSLARAGTLHLTSSESDSSRDKKGLTPVFDGLLHLGLLEMAADNSLVATICLLTSYYTYFVQAKRLQRLVESVLGWVFDDQLENEVGDEVVYPQIFTISACHLHWYWTWWLSYKMTLMVDTNNKGFLNSHSVPAVAARLVLIQGHLIA